MSILMATYNRSDVLRWAIRSVLTQTYLDWELIIVGDACTDDTPEIVASFDDPRIRYVNRETSFGEQSGPNNDAFQLSSGRLIAYLNHDDLWFPDHLQTLIDYQQATNADLVHALPLSIDVNDLAFCGLTNAELRYDPSHFVPASLWLLRREVVEHLNGWRPARDIHAHNPSQDFLFRAWQQSFDLRRSPKFTAVLFASGGRPGCYQTLDDRQHARWFQDLQVAETRERLATNMTMQLTQQLAQARSASFDVLHRWIDRLLIALRLHPNAVRNRLLGRRPGFWIEHLRSLRGLSPLPNRERP